MRRPTPSSCSSETAELDAQWEAARVIPALSAALDNPDVDYVLAIGAGISYAATQVPLTKPVVATFVQRPDFGSIHEQENNRSLTENLAFVQLPHLVETDFVLLRNIFPYPDTAHLLLPESHIGVSPTFEEEIRALERAANVRIEQVPLGDDVEQAVAQLPADATVAFVTVTTPRWTAGRSAARSSRH